jgi:hypothetical protein
VEGFNSGERAVSIQELNKIVDWMLSKGISTLHRMPYKPNTLVEKIETLFKNINAEKLFFKEHNSNRWIIRAGDKTPPSGYYYEHRHNGYCLDFCEPYDEGVCKSVRLSKDHIKAYRSKR